MRSFDLYDAKTVQDAVALLKQFSARPGGTVKVVGGGSDLVGGVMKDWVHGKGMPIPEVLIDLTGISELAGVKAASDGFTIGTATTLTDIIESKDLGDRVPLLVK